MAPADSQPSTSALDSGRAAAPTHSSSLFVPAAVAALPLVLLAFLLARLVWLPYFFGLFFFLVAGLLVGAVLFRMLRVQRPIARSRLLTLISVFAVFGGSAVLVWEYRYVAGTIGAFPRFAAVCRRASEVGEPIREVRRRATASYRSGLARDWWPGGPIGYARWAVGAGTMPLTVDGETETVDVEHRGPTWAARTVGGLLLMGLGLWSSCAALRRSVPVTNILPPGEEPLEED